MKLDRKTSLMLVAVICGVFLIVNGILSLGNSSAVHETSCTIGLDSSEIAYVQGDFAGRVVTIMPEGDVQTAKTLTELLNGEYTWVDFLEDTEENPAGVSLSQVTFYNQEDEILLDVFFTDNTLYVPFEDGTGYDRYIKASGILDTGAIAEVFGQ